MQDCKAFQGELFGICNLFRDLSDKLFTSEIVESHETNKKDGLETEQQKKTYISEETNLLVSESETRSCSESVRTTSKPDIEFEDVGMFHAILFHILKFLVFFPHKSIQ